MVQMAAALWALPFLPGALARQQIVYRRDEPIEIVPVKPKFRTVPDPDMPPLLDFSVLSAVNLSSWNDEAMALTSTRFIPGQYQARVPIANGGMGVTVSAAGPFWEMDVNQTNHHVGPESDVIEGWPMWDKRMTFSTVAGFYDCQAELPGENYPWLKQYGCESVIAGTPHPLGLQLQCGDCVLNSTADPKTISNYSQRLSFQDGLTSWRYTWSPKGCGEDACDDVYFDIEFDSFASRVRPQVAATELRVTPHGHEEVDVTVIDVLDGRGAKRSFLGLKAFGRTADSDYMLVSNHPDGLPDVEAFTVSIVNALNIPSNKNVTLPGNDNTMTVAQSWDVTLARGKTSTFQKFVSVASTDGAVYPRSLAISAANDAALMGFDALLAEHVQSWNELMKPKLISSYRDPATGHLPPNEPMLEKLQIAAVADRYYLIQNLLSEGYKHAGRQAHDFGLKVLNVNGLSVGGLTSDTYGGMLFWDQDLWMYPAIAITNPEFALQIIKSRLKGYEQAMANTQQPHVQAKYKFNEKAALYPWTSGRFGNETSTGPAMDYQYHINTDIAWMILQYRRITGDDVYFKETLWPVVESIGHSISTLLVKEDNKWTIKNMTDPDEYANSINDGAFTMASFSQVMNEIIKYQQENNLDVDSKWVDIAENVAPLKAPSGITKEYHSMENDVMIKQAAVSLLTFPLGFTRNYTLEDMRKDLFFYSQKQTPDGPAMGTAIGAIAENLVAVAGCSAYTLDLQSKFPNYRAPWYQMSEQSTDDMNANGGVPPSLPFLTGHGGSLQVNPFGPLGLDLTQEELTIQPSLPWPLRHLQIQDFWFRGANIRAQLNATHTSVTWLESAAPTVIKPATGPIVLQIGTPHGRRAQETYSLSRGETVVVENDMYWQSLSTPGNVLQCQPTTSEDAVMPGQYAGAATDGNPGTRWQPASKARATLFVDLSSQPIQKYSQISFNWGARPAAEARVGFSNSTAETPAEMLVIAVQPDRVGADEERGQSVPYVGNTTVFDVQGERWTGRFAWLQVEGCAGCEGDLWDSGATVGEFEVIASA